MTTLKERLTDVTVAAAIIFSILGIVFYSITYPILYFVEPMTVRNLIVSSARLTVLIAMCSFIACFTIPTIKKKANDYRDKLKRRVKSGALE